MNEAKVIQKAIRNQIKKVRLYAHTITLNRKGGRTRTGIGVGRDTIEFLHLMPDINEERNVDGECYQGECCSEERDQGSEEDHGDVREE